MKRIALASLAALSLAACTNGAAPVSASTVTTVLVDSQLFCRVGTAVVAMAQASGSTVGPILAKGASNAYVRAACGVVQGLAVSPPVAPDATPVLVVPAQAIPLQS